MDARRTTLLVLVLACVAGSWPAPPARAQSDEATKVACAFVFNFAQYTQWPASAFQGKDDPLIITVVGSDQSVQVLAAVARGRRIGERTVQVRHAPLPAEDDEGADAAERHAAFLDALRASHLVYVDTDHRRAAHRVLAAVRGYDVLTIGFVNGFARAGGMLGLKQRGDHMVFEANLGAIRRTRLSVSSKVLRLAEIVDDGDNQP